MTSIPPALLDEWAAECDFVFHLAGVNRPKDPAEFMTGNFGFASTVLEALIAAGNRAPVLLSSSIQAALANPYGISKKAGEDLFLEYGKAHGVEVFVFRLANLFGKWCRPNYNSVVATFCYNISHDIPIQVNDPATMVSFVYIDDVVEAFISALEGRPLIREDQYYSVQPTYDVAIGTLAELLESFYDARENRSVPQLDDPFVKKLYSTYISYLPRDQFSYDLQMHRDERGSFTEFIRTPDRGQISVNVAKPGITKGNHWHHTKMEKFLVVSGRAAIRFRKIDSAEVLEYTVNGERLQVVDIPPGYTHSIENIGETDLVTVMWANEPFDPQRPDTYFLPVKED